MTQQPHSEGHCETFLAVNILFPLLKADSDSGAEVDQWPGPASVESVPAPASASHRDGVRRATVTGCLRGPATGSHGWAATSGSESGASGRHRSSLLRHLDVQVRHAYKLDHRPGAAASRLGVDLRHWHLRHGGRLLRHGQADCAVPVRPLARGIWRLQAWSLPPGPCVPRFKFALRGPGAFASTADRPLTMVHPRRRDAGGSGLRRTPALVGLHHPPARRCRPLPSPATASTLLSPPVTAPATARGIDSESTPTGNSRTRETFGSSRTGPPPKENRRRRLGR
jgi:hypothetical protein